MVSQIKQYTEACSGRTVSANVFCIFTFVFTQPRNTGSALLGIREAYYAKNTTNVIALDKTDFTAGHLGKSKQRASSFK